MSPSILVSQSYPSAPGVFTPIHFYPDDSAGVKQDPSLEASGNYWTPAFRDGLPTPPSDMTGVAYNAIPSSSYGGQLNRVSLHPYSTNSRHNLAPLPSALVPSVKSQSNPSSSKNTMGSGLDQRRACNSLVAPCPQIPVSINSSKGSLAEFAAQVRISTSRTRPVLTWIDDLSLLVREYGQVDDHGECATSLPNAWSRCHSVGRFSEVGVEYPVDYAGGPECDPTGPPVHIPAEEI